jgi:LEA14-like dessication related protein
VEQAEYELVVDGAASPKVTQPLKVTLAAGERRDFTLEQPFTFVTGEAGLKALDAKGGALLMALRGTLSTSAGPLELARSKEVRTPRLPHLKLLEYEAGRFSSTEVQVVFHLGVVNPNPFDITLSWLDYTATLGGRVVSKGAVGAGERVGAASTGVFDVTAVLDEASHGAEAGALVKGLAIPWELTGLLRTTVSTELLQTHGTVKLNAMK